MIKSKGLNLDQQLSSKLEPREQCFLIMSYKPKEHYDKVYEQLRSLIEGATVLRCIRADRELQPGRDLLGKVHEQILGASVVVADVTEHSPNIYYEYGYASAHNRLPVLIAREGAELPTDLVGKELLWYRDTPGADGDFSEKLLSCINERLTSPLPEQRRMLASPHPFPAYLITAPRVPGVGSKHRWHPDERKTFGDMLGIVGILTAYGNLFGTRMLPELLHAERLAENVFANTANFFCIGSSKVNPATKHFLPLIQQGLSPAWQMIEKGPGKDKRVIFQGDPSIDEMLAAPITKTADGACSDFGLIVRASHPDDLQHLVLIVAGRHSIGTHAACMVATRQDLIAALEKKLGKHVSLRDTTQPFWAIVRGTLDSNGIFSDNVEIVKAGGYVRSAP